MTRSPHAGEPIVASEPGGDDDSIAAALEDVSIPTLVLSMVHLTGDRSWLDDDRLRPVGLFLNEVQGFMDEDAKAEVRRRALRAIMTYRDGGCVLPAPPSASLVHEMMSWLVCEPVPDEYVPMMLEELDLDGTDPRRVDWSGIDASVRADLPVVIVGCGMSGLLAGVRLGEAGIPYTIVEKNAGVGGTWYENQYPGARVDVGNHFYCYSFEPSDHWTEFFSRQPELQAYFQRVMDRHGVDQHVRWETEVERMVWDEAGASWAVEVSGPGGDDRIEARAVITAVGQLNRPKLPDLEGIDAFDGPAFHSARWDHDVDLTGKRVALVGAGASGLQIAPTIADEVAELHIFQRTAQWMFPNPHYHEAVTDGVRWAMRHLPFYARWFRFLLFWPACDGGMQAARIDPEWDDGNRSISAINDMARAMFTDWIAGQVGDDPELLAKVIPDYPATGKRTLQDDGSWLRTLRRDHVDLHRESIERITATGIETAEGHVDVDVIVFATGFHGTRFLWPMEIVGRDGVTLQETWGATPAAHLGISTPGFPNLFSMYGPGTNLASGGSLIFHSECQMRWIERCLQQLAAGARTVEATEAATKDWFERTQAELDTMVWTHPSIEHSWYKSDDGRIYGLSPWRLVDYWDWTREPDPADLHTT
ncbi:flavin-containing monooxygenase [Actinospongicola halichondriae]|uniref:flavin-containing monooxygenase n=1 Tax=Actinospongicola halichondriae TaxID=3236844 RepID=UPI003D3B4B04